MKILMADYLRVTQIILNNQYQTITNLHYFSNRFKFIPNS